MARAGSGLRETLRVENTGTEPTSAVVVRSSGEGLEFDVPGLEPGELVYVALGRVFAFNEFSVSTADDSSSCQTVTFETEAFPYCEAPLSYRTA